MSNFHTKWFSPLPNSLLFLVFSSGIRTVFNILGPLTNPTHPKYQLSGVFAKELGPIYIKTLKNLGMERAMVVHGAEVLDEIRFLTQKLVTFFNTLFFSIAGETFTWFLDNGKITEKTVSCCLFFAKKLIEFDRFVQKILD